MTTRICLILSLVLIVFSLINAQDVQWLKSIHGESHVSSRGLTVTNSGYIISCGGYNSDTVFFGNMFLLSRSNGTDAYLIKYDLEGNPVWADNPGGTSGQCAWNTTTDYNDNIYMIGCFSGAFNFGVSVLEAEEYDLHGMLLKYDDLGNKLWGINMNSMQVYPKWIELDSDGNIVVCGEFHSGIPLTIGDTTLSAYGGIDIFVAKFSTDGELFWARSFGGSLVEFVEGMCTDGNNHIYITGGSNSNNIVFGNYSFNNSCDYNAGFIAQINPDGEVVWADFHDEAEHQYFTGIKVDSAFNIIMFGSYTGELIFGQNTISTLPGYGDSFIAKYNSTHFPLWIKKACSSDENIRAQQLTLDKDGNIIVEAYSWGDFQFEDTTVINNGSKDIIIAKFDPDGENLLWFLHGGGDSGDESYDIAIGPSGHIYANGSFYSSELSFGSDTILNTISSLSSLDAFILSIGPDCFTPDPAFNATIDGLSVQFSPIGIADTFQWDFGDGSTSNLMDPLHVYDTAGTYNVCLIVSNICGDDTSCQDIHVCIEPEADFVAYANDLEVSFYQLSQWAVEFYWDFGDGSYSTEAEPVHTYPTHDIYIVTLTAINECGTDQHIDTLIIIPPMCNFSFTVENGAVYFIDESLNAYSCFWEFGDGNTSSLPNPVHHYNNYGAYHCCLTIENDQGVFTFCDSIFYCEKAIADFEIVINYGQISINDFSDKAESWMWDFGDGTSSFLAEPSHEYENSGDYTVCQHTSNACSEDVLCKDISIEVGGARFSIIISPISSPEDLEINIPADGIYTSNIYTIQGYLYFNEEVSKKAGETYQIDISSLPSGIYILDVSSQSMHETLKFSITRL